MLDSLFFFSIEAFIVFGAIVGSHLARGRFGLGPFYATLSVVSAAAWWVTLSGLTAQFGNIDFMVGSAIFYTASLLGVFIVYVTEGPKVGRLAIFTVVVTSIGFVLINFVLNRHAALMQPGALPTFPVPNTRIAIASPVVTLIDLVLLSITWEASNRLYAKLWLPVRLFVVLLFVLWVDVLLFVPIVFGDHEAFLPILQGNLTSRLFLAVSIAPIMAVYVEYERQRLGLEFGQRSIFAIMRADTVERQLDLAKEQLRAQQSALAQSESRLRLLFEHAPVCLWQEDFSEVKKRVDKLPQADRSDLRSFFENSPELLDTYISKVRIVDTNAASITLHEAKSKFALFDAVGSTFTADARAVFVEELQALADGATSWSSETTLLTFNGGLREVTVSLVVSPQASDWSDVYIAITDITDLKRSERNRLELERQVQHGQKLEGLGVLAGGIAHDFNNILMVVLGNTDLALREVEPGHKAYRRIRSIENASIRASELVKQMLAYSGRGNFVIEPVAINALVREMASMIDVSVSKKATMTFELCDNLPTIMGDTTQVRQVLLNLITNASEALDNSAGSIAVATGVSTLNAQDVEENAIFRARDAEPPAPGDYAFLEVRDSGCGMGEDTVARIFDPFFSTKFAGRGLGMAAVQGIVQGHHGLLTIATIPGIESVLRVYFPVSDIPLPALVGDAVHSATAVPDDQPCVTTVLIADDEAAVLTVGTHLLEALGYSVITATNGREAIDAFMSRADDIACVLLDLNMPEVDGVQAYQEITHIAPRIPVILCSGYNEQEATEHFSADGLAAFMQKPYRLESLEKVLRQALEN